ncbi:IS4 family transposase [Acidihalobacter ferrooxydans]|uniref:IS4 family transposase n=1 Tax=Acidihalobacter ferrooxydans TaxID=1765967 RepID=A0A1P8UJX8_9GAMM|nr:IS4 family transposase [Acidihalobacter ferrooxydans]APZ44138.1 IS4 family transposase [Acidihalobacter ferrooxydans]
MYTGKLVFAQAIDHLPLHTLRRCIQLYNGNRHVKRFSCQEQYRCMAFAQLTYRESLRDIEACLNAQSNKLYHMGIRSRIARSTLAEANEKRDWRIYADFAQSLIQIARRLYADEDLGLELDNTVYALDASTIDLCLSVFPWAHFRQTKAAVKLHTLLDLRGNIPSFIHISDGKLHDVNVLDLLLPEPGAFYIVDRGYTDFERLHQLHQALAFFVIRAKSNLQFRRVYSRPVDKQTGLRCDQTIALTGVRSARHYPDPLRRIQYYDAETDQRLVFLTNNFTIPAIPVTDLYRYPWQVELIFKWIKQHLRIKSFFGTSENAVKTQVWIAVSVYVLVAIIKKRLDIPASLYSILQILSLTIFETMPLNQLLTEDDPDMTHSDPHNQLNLFE